MSEIHFYIRGVLVVVVGGGGGGGWRFNPGYLSFLRQRTRKNFMGDKEEVWRTKNRGKREVKWLKQKYRQELKHRISITLPF